ncbi:hypothetical protein [Nocardiopsis trehalosi]|uniref:hypothetical protein n=1 Tax=Nocardiopsis trehalosi TaxID=109329 RepID=UPI00082ADBDE|nr:hypothetical protein [Nocardiopsis trehalosi]
MSNPSIASKLMSKVKGIFGSKDRAASTAGAAGPDTPAQERPERTAASAARETAKPEAAKPEAEREKTETASAPETAKPEAAPGGDAPGTAPAPEGATPTIEPGADATQAAPAPAAEAGPGGAPAQERVEEQTAGTASASATGPDAKAGATPEEPKADEPALVAPGEEAAVAEELAAAEATTQVASDEVLEKVRRGNAPAADDLAVPGYDDLTLPSIRARLRKLTLEQVRDLRAYEVAHAERPEFIRMYDNRIAKLTAEGAAE